MTAATHLATPAIDPRRYHEAAPRTVETVVERLPVCLYLEVTNRCNLLCTTCPRTYVELEPPADMSWDLFTRIVDQVPISAAPCFTGSASRCWSRTCPGWCATSRIAEPTSCSTPTARCCPRRTDGP